MESAAPGPGALTLFHEEREDLIVAVGGDGEPTTRRTGWCGVGATGIDGASLLYRSDPDPDALRAIARRALAGGGRIGPPPANDSPHPPPATGELDVAGTLRLVTAARERIRTLHPDARVRARCVMFEQHVRIARPAREIAEDLRRGFRLEIEVRIARRGRRASATAESTRRPDDEELPRLVDRLVERAERRLDAVPLGSGSLAIALAPGVGGVVAHELVGHALEADTVAAGQSWLAAAAAPIADPRLVVLDDPRRARAPWKIDDEGSAASPTALVRGGSVCGRLHDLRTAGRMGERPTGHGRRASYRDPVRPRMGCTFIGPGRVAAEELLDDVGDGVYVRRMVSASVDNLSGRAVFRITDADRLERGAPGPPLRPFLLFVDGPSCLQAIRCADDLAFDVSAGSCHRAGQTLITSVGAPTISLGVNGVVS